MPACKQLKRDKFLTPMQLYSWANKHVTGIFVSKQDIAEHSLKIEPRLQNAKTVVGTRSHHRFIPLADNKLRMHHLSMDQIGTVVQVGVHVETRLFRKRMEFTESLTVVVGKGRTKNTSGKKLIAQPGYELYLLACESSALTTEPP